MNSIITNKIETVTSMEVANMIGKEHKDLLKNVRRYINQFNQGKISPVDFFQESEYIDSKGETRPCFNVTRKGCDFIANKLTGQKGTEFTAKYVNKFHELEENNLTNSLVRALSSITESMLDMKSNMENRLSQMEEKLENQKCIEDSRSKKPYNPWFAKMNPKYKLLEEYFNVTRGQLYKEILMELENIYDIDTVQIQADYCYENNVESCYPLEPYEFVPKYREMIEQIVNSNLIKYGIAAENDPIASTKHVTIFDTPAEETDSTAK